ncbi:QsdR family transcriptional regulator [Modestobacter sp. SSW1-42]|uniref:QsdR family transcriptional regulator n=1 Tax=Modestobacter sp. SSW1-42 TaxID=596372 RepID=UPI0039868E70
MIASPEEVVEAAAYTLLRGERLDTSTLAAELGISRVTLYRRVGNRDAILGEALWVMARGALLIATEVHDARPPGAEPPRRLRLLEIAEEFRHLVSIAPALQRLIAEEPTTTLRIVTDPRGRVQPRLVEAYTDLFQRDVDELGLVPQVPLPVLAFAVVRLAESFLYSDVMVARAPDLAAATTVLDALVTGVIGLSSS